MSLSLRPRTPGARVCYGFETGTVIDFVSLLSLVVAVVFILILLVSPPLRYCFAIVIPFGIRCLARYLTFKGFAMVECAPRRLVGYSPVSFRLSWPSVLHPWLHAPRLCRLWLWMALFLLVMVSLL